MADVSHRDGELAGRKTDLRGAIREELPELRADCAILFTEHHQAHAASAFFPSPFNEAAILTVDGVGEWATTTIGVGRGAEIRLLEEMRFPHSLGLLYSAFTDYCGFRINSGEYKLMGLAPYGEPKYAEAIRANLVESKPDGSFRLNLDYFDFLGGTTMTNARFCRLFGGPPRGPEEPIEQRHMDVARSIQLVCEEIMLRLARRARDLTGCEQSLPGRRGRAQLRGQRAHRARKNFRTALDSTCRGRCRRRARRGAGSVAQPGSAGFRTPMIRCAARCWGRNIPMTKLKAVLKSHQAVYSRYSEDELLETTVDYWRMKKSWAGFRDGWNLARARWGTAPFLAMPARRGCNR